MYTYIHIYIYIYIYINHHLNCNDKGLIYLLSCKGCGLQYVGFTTDKFRLRWNNSKENDRKALRGEEHIQPEHFEHFATDNHNCFLETLEQRCEIC